MIEDITVDYDRVESSTATMDGDRIVVTLATELGSTNISLPTAEVPRLILAISTAAGIANEARTRTSSALALPLRTLRMCLAQTPDQVQFVVEFRGGAEMVFEIDRRAAAEFMHDWIEALRPGNPPSANRLT